MIKRVKQRKSWKKTQSELVLARKDVMAAQKILEHMKKVTETKMCEAIKNKEFYRDDPHLISVYAATLDLDDFEEEEENKGLTPRIEEKFLVEVKAEVDTSDTVETERLGHIQNLVLEQVRKNKTRSRSKTPLRCLPRPRTESTSSTGGGRSKRFNLSDRTDGRSPVRQKTSLPLLTAK